MRDTVIRWPEPAEHFTLGRNGCSKALGVRVAQVDGCVWLEPITSRGDLARARIVVPMAHVGELSAALAPDQPSAPISPLDALAGLADAGLTFSQCVGYFARRQTEQEPELDAYWRAAEGMSCVREGECEIDGQGPEGATLVSKGSDAGAYVLAWVWVDDESAGIETEDDGEAGA